MLKRGFDIVFSLVGLVLLCPFFLFIALLIKLYSKGPVFFRQVRIGKNGRPFKMLKFRTMMEAKHWRGQNVSPKNDPRVTTLGAALRRFKINELPQLINVLKGDMSFVGPRPEVPEFVALYSPEQKKVLCATPGIVGPSQINLRNEEELYPEGVNPGQYYIEHILQEKLEIDLNYIRNRSFLKDVGYVLQGIMITITGAITRRHLFENAEQIAVFICDTVICGLSYFLAYFLRMEGTFPSVEKAILLHTLPYVIIVRMFTFTCLGLYGTLIRYVSFDELIKIVKGVTFSSVVIVLLTFFLGERGHPRSVFAIDWFVLVCLLGGYRLSFRVLKDYLSRSKNESKGNILIYGAGNLGDLALRYTRMQGDGTVIAFIDDDPKKRKKNFQGLKVLGNRYDIESLVKLYRIDKIIIAMSRIGSKDLDHIKSLCERVKVEYEIFALAK
jgi:lipopolysaccharide/colanic/teichoic acid biosynthesis glycosyltransferase